MAYNELTKKLEKMRIFWIDYLPDDGALLFDKKMKEVIELSKKYKR